MSLEFEGGDASSCWTEFGSQNFTVDSTVERPACHGGLLARVAILLLMIFETIVVIRSRVIIGCVWCSNLARSLRFSSVPASGKASVVRVQVAQEVVDALEAGFALRCAIRACPLPAIKRIFCGHIRWRTSVVSLV